MPDHIHDLPVCGYGAHNPHAPSCAGMGREVACGEIVDPDHPHFGRALCRHRDIQGGDDNGDNDGPGVDTGNGDNDTGSSGDSPEPDNPGTDGTGQSGDGSTGPSSGSQPGDGEPTDGLPATTSGGGNSFWDWLGRLWEKFKRLLSWFLSLLHTLFRFGVLALLILLWNYLAGWFPVLLTWPGFVAFIRFLWHWTWGIELPVPLPDSMPDPPPVRPPPNEPPETGTPEPEVPGQPDESDEPEKPEEPLEPEPPTTATPIYQPGPQGGDCEVEIHWWFGRWVRCKGGKRCPPGKHCRLLWRRRGSTETWTDAGIVKGGSVKFSTYMEYRCVCRSEPW